MLSVTDGYFHSFFKDASSVEEVEEGTAVPEGAPPSGLPREDSGMGESGEEFQVGEGTIAPLEPKIMTTLMNSSEEKSTTLPVAMRNCANVVLEACAAPTQCRANYREHTMS